MIEGKIYYYIKNYLKTTRWDLLCGEPPDGSDDLMRIEIRNNAIPDKGSKGSLKIDFIALKEKTLLLLELKPKLDLGDIEKLSYIVKEKTGELFEALKERCNLKEDSYKKIIKGLGLNKYSEIQIPDDFVIISLSDDLKIEVVAGDLIEPEVLELFSSPFTF